MNETVNPGRGVVVVDRRPLERNLVRFILQENGFEVLAEAATPAEAIRAVEARPPAVVVLHENAAWENGQPTMPLLRDVLPEGRILIIAPAFGVVRVELLRDADAVLEEGVGFKDLPFVVGRLAGNDGVKAAGTVAPLPPPAADTSYPRRARWVNRVQGATAAAIVFLALVVARAAVPPGPETIRPETVVALTRAQNSLDAMQAATNAPPNALIQRAVTLAEDRAAAIDAGADVSTLDAQIRALVERVAPTLPSDAATTLMWIFADVNGLSTPTPTPSPTPTPTPTETPSPKPSEQPSPSPPVVIPVPPTTATPTPTEAPSPTDTGTPSPTDTGTPSPSPTDTGTPSASPTDTGTPSTSPTDTGTGTPSTSPTQTPSTSPTGSPSTSPTGSPTTSPTQSPSTSPTESPSPSPSESPSASPTPSPSPSPTASASPSPTPTSSPPPTASASSESASSSPTVTDSDGDGDGDLGTASGVAVTLFPGFGIVASALARRRARRSNR